jgi:hypothetical protein
MTTMAQYLPVVITGRAEARAKDSKYQASGSTTHCNEFLCDLVEDIIGGPCEALRKADLSAPALANVQCDQLKASAKWQAMSFSSDPKGVFEEAQKAANNGHLVVVTYKNPVAGGHGHVALVVPAPAPMFVSGKWGMAVPKIAQAGPSITVTGATPQSVYAALDLSWGFGPARKPDMELYTYVG